MKAFDASAVLPPLYASWIDSLLRFPIPPERHATCDDCAMCPPERKEEPGTLYFSPRVKCCTYEPRLPNYLVGGALEDRDFDSAAGRATLERRIDRGLGVTPLGIDQSARYNVLYRESEAFGRADSLRCPHYLEEGGGRCGIWRHRNSVCATWFCKHERGAIGLAFWKRLRDLLAAIEVDLSTWCVLQSGLGVEALGTLFSGCDRSNERTPLSAADLDERPEREVARKLWGRRLGHERDFYRECARRVGELSWSDVEGIGSPELAVRARLARQSFTALRSSGLPERLTAGPLEVLATGFEGVRVMAYLGSDPLDLDPDILRILPYFDGRSNEKALASIERDLGLRVEEDLVRKLADFEILLPSKRRLD